MSDTATPDEPDVAYTWAHEHFCEPHLTALYNTGQGGRMLNEVGFPVRLDELPETFCSTCLEWFKIPHTEGSHHRPPIERNTP